MKISFKKGLGFGLTSGIITTLGLMIGLNATTGSKAAVIGGILVIAIADAMSDALGVHVSEESENHHSTREIWEATFATFISKFIFALTFVVPVLLFKLNIAIIVSIGWGLFLIILFSLYLAKKNKESARSVIFEHLFITILVIILTQLVGSWINKIFI